MDRSKILETAKEYITKNREQDYGDAEFSFNTIADFWNIYIAARFDSAAEEIDCWDSEIGIHTELDYELTAEDVANMMALLKIARIATGTAKADSFIDAAGYIACGGELAEC